MQPSTPRPARTALDPAPTATGLVDRTGLAAIEEAADSLRELIDGLLESVSEPADSPSSWQRLNELLTEVHAHLSAIPGHAPEPLPATHELLSTSQVGPQSALPVVDLEGALERTGGNGEILYQVSRLFLEMWPDFMTRMRHASETGDAAELARIAHRIKGSALSLGAERLAALAAEAEDEWSLSDLSLVSPRIEALSALFEEFAAASEVFRARRNR